MQQGPVLVCVSTDLSGESDGLGVPAFNRFVTQSAFKQVSPLNCRSSVHSALISISRPEKLLNKGLSQGQRENCSSLRGTSHFSRSTFFHRDDLSNDEEFKRASSVSLKVR
jgi:hypothetical protein